MFKKLFCRHKWKSHAKKDYNWSERIVIPDTQSWIHPCMETINYAETQEILICECCGKIKKIKY